MLQTVRYPSANLLPKILCVRTHHPTLNHFQYGHSKGREATGWQSPKCCRATASSKGAEIAGTSKMKLSVFLSYSTRTFLFNHDKHLLVTSSRETCSFLWPATQGFTSMRCACRTHFRFGVLVYSLKAIFGYLFENNTRIPCVVIHQLYKDSKVGEEDAVPVG